MVSSTSGCVLAHLVIASRTLVNHTSSNRAMATPILIFWADWAGVLPRAIAIIAIAGRKNFASFISFISFFSRGGCSATQSGRVERLLPEKVLFNYFWGVQCSFIRLS